MKREGWGLSLFRWGEEKDGGTEYEIGEYKGEPANFKIGFAKSLPSLSSPPLLLLDISVPPSPPSFTSNYPSFSNILISLPVLLPVLLSSE